jgi:hypothetical protein
MFLVVNVAKLELLVVVAEVELVELVVVVIQAVDSRGRTRRANNSS